MKTIQIKVKPNARHSSLTCAKDETWLAMLKSPPADGRANQELIGLIAAEFGCRKSAVVIKSGAGARLKLVQIHTD